MNEKEQEKILVNILTTLNKQNFLNEAGKDYCIEVLNKNLIGMDFYGLNKEMNAKMKEMK